MGKSSYESWFWETEAPPPTRRKHGEVRIKKLEIHVAEFVSNICHNPLEFTLETITGTTPAGIEASIHEDRPRQRTATRGLVT
jgi:hypothetical protein